MNAEEIEKAYWSIKHHEAIYSFIFLVVLGAVLLAVTLLDRRK